MTSLLPSYSTSLMDVLAHSIAVSPKSKRINVLYFLVSLHLTRRAFIDAITVNILMRITKARDEVVRAILVDNMVYTIDSCFGFFQELRQVAGWILQEQPSLHEIQLRLEQFQICEEPSSDEALVQETLQQCWKALRSAREDAKSFVQQCDRQDNVRDLAKQDSAVCEEELHTGVADEYSMNSEIDGTEEESQLYGCWEVREDWMELISDTASVHSCQTV